MSNMYVIFQYIYAMAIYIIGRGSVRVRDSVTNVLFKFSIHVSSASRMSTVWIKH